MAAPVYIVDVKTGKSVPAGPGEALAVSPVKASKAYNATLGTDNTAVNIVPAKGDMAFYITGILISGNKSIDPNVDATVSIYTGVAADTALSSASSTIITANIARSGQLVLNPIFLSAAPGQFINAETTDDDVRILILGYYLTEIA